MKVPGDLKVAIVGGGGREHALAWKIAQSQLVKELYCLPGNGGTASVNKCQNVDVPVMDFIAIGKFCQEKKVDLVVIGPDDPLAAGITDELTAMGLRVFGPTRAAAKLEWSKIFAKEFMVAQRIPTARYLVCHSYDEGLDLLREHPWARVIKVDGLALGKGVFVVDTEQEGEEALRQIFRERKFGKAGSQVLLEERLAGEEISCLMFVDGKRLSLMPPSQDHKRRLEGDRGPNTGGMGCYSPVDLYSRCRQEIEEQVLAPLSKALRAGALDFKGVLYAGLMIETRRLDDGHRQYQPYVLEFNARFGDPETQTLLPLMQSDLVPVLWAVTQGRLNQVQAEWSKAASCCVVACAADYPQSSSRGHELTIGKMPAADIQAFHAGSKLNGKKLETNGGRVVCVTALGASMDEAVDKAYQGIDAVSFADKAYRKDIARRALTGCLSR